MRNMPPRTNEKEDTITNTTDVKTHLASAAVQSGINVDTPILVYQFSAQGSPDSFPISVGFACEGWLRGAGGGSGVRVRD